MPRVQVRALLAATRRQPQWSPWGMQNPQGTLLGIFGRQSRKQTLRDRARRGDDLLFQVKQEILRESAQKADCPPTRI